MKESELGKPLSLISEEKWALGEAVELRRKAKLLQLYEMNFTNFISKELRYQEKEAKI